MRPKVILVGALVAAALALSACGTDSSTPSGTGTDPGSVTPAGASGDHDPCLIGTWKVDVQDLANQAAAKMAALNGTGTGTGDVTFVFGDQITLTHANSVAITTNNGVAMTMRFVYSGSTTSSEWKAAGGTLSGTFPTNGITVDATATLNGQPFPVPSGLTAPPAPALDQGSIAYTCSGNSATLTNPAFTWKLTKA